MNRAREMYTKGLEVSMGQTKQQERYDDCLKQLKEVGIKKTIKI